MFFGFSVNLLFKAAKNPQPEEDGWAELPSLLHGALSLCECTSLLIQAEQTSLSPAHNSVLKALAEQVTNTPLLSLSFFPFFMFQMWLLVLSVLVCVPLCLLSSMTCELQDK